MKFYAAPLESMTTCDFRNVHASLSTHIEKYFIPFLQPMAGGSLTKKGEREIDPRNNEVPLSRLVPQIISKNAEETLTLIFRLQELGYSEVNLNFGCPSGTVTSKGKGSGIFKDLATMEDYLSQVIAGSPLPISIKTRIGFSSPEEWDAIVSIYAKYPIKELIIHPRTGKEMYTGPLHWQALDGLDQRLKMPIIYNGEVKNSDDIAYLAERFPYLQGIMIGRGLFEAPDMLEENLSLERRRAFVTSFAERLAACYLNRLPWGNASYPVKGFWHYLLVRFENAEKLGKSLLKATDQVRFLALSRQILRGCPLAEREGSGLRKGGE